MTAWRGWLCYHLDEHGFPCNRKTMRPLSMCSLHRETERVRSPEPSRAEYQRNRRASLRNAGLPVVMEVA